MSVTVTPANVATPQIQASAPPPPTKPGTKGAAPLFDDIAANTHTPFPSFSGC